MKDVTQNRLKYMCVCDPTLMSFLDTNIAFIQKKFNFYSFKI